MGNIFPCKFSKAPIGKESGLGRGEISLQAIGTLSALENERLYQQPSGEE